MIKNEELLSSLSIEIILDRYTFSLLLAIIIIIIEIHDRASRENR